jgi:DNA-binding transcriptional regulator LsrR (DeoR family)
MNTYNQNLERAGRKRRAHFLKLYSKGDVTQAELARKAGVSRARMQWMINKAKEEALI